MAVEPFYGGSHRMYLDGVSRHSRHRWSCLTGKPVHWKWRMRSAPLEMAVKLPRHLAAHGHPDAIWCSDMLDLPQWLGFAANAGLQDCPTMLYFHESQWTYPQTPGSRVDYHYGYTNLLSAIAADMCLFNSAFHRDEFLSASEQFIRRMPDAKSYHDIERLRKKCQVVYPGFEPTHLGTAKDDGVPAIGWVSRWEHDKRPDRFMDLLRSLRNAEVEFRLILLGPRPRDGSPELDTIRLEFADAIRFDGFAVTRSEYANWLSEMDVVVSTADHEFFGIAICEAIDAGAVAVVPDRLSYPEIVATPTRYHSLADATDIIRRCADETSRFQLVHQGREHAKSFHMSQTVAQLDRVVASLATH